MDPHEPMAPGMDVEVVYALATEQKLLTVRVGADATVLQAIRESGVLESYPHMDPTRVSVGVFGKTVTLDTRLRAGDRVEIYRPLMVDPKEARRRRGTKKKSA